MFFQIFTVLHNYSRAYRQLNCAAASNLNGLSIVFILEGEELIG
jgi:hypothetical protein